VKVFKDRLTPARRAWHASVVALASALVALMGLFPAPASAITRATVLSRAHTWVKKKVRYSQSSYFAGYRRDCSGFVSMAWKLGRSYTSRTLQQVAHRIPLSKLKPGDAVHTPGHVTIFVAWKNKARGLYVAMEESTWGEPALHKVRPLGHGATALRYRHITEPPLLVARVPAPHATPGADTTGSITPTPSADATPAIGTTGAIVPVDVSLVELRPTASPIGTFRLPTMTRLALVPFYA
jgi:hypothetical protein